MNESVANDGDMKNLKERLAVILSETIFDFEYTEIRGDGKRTPVSKPGLSAAGLAENYNGQRRRMGSKRAEVRAPETMMSQLIGELRRVFGCFIDPSSDLLGHAFPIDAFGGSSIAIRHRADGIPEFESKSTLVAFARCLVTAAAIIGVDRTIRLLADWKCGAPVRFKTSTIVNGLTLDAPLAPRADIEIVPLPLTTGELPRLPDRGDLSGKDYLGLTVLSLSMSVSPALFRPKPDAGEANVRSSTEKDIDLNVVYDALSLLANCHISESFLWTEYEEAAPFSLKDWQTWQIGGNSMERASHKKLSMNLKTGTVTPERQDGVSITRLDEGEVLHMIEALQSCGSELRIAVDRWKRSMRTNTHVVDRYIDLRIALDLSLKKVAKFARRFPTKLTQGRSRYEAQAL